MDLLSRPFQMCSCVPYCHSVTNSIEDISYHKTVSWRPTKFNSQTELNNPYARAVIKNKISKQYKECNPT